MGNACRYRALHGPKVREQRDPDSDGAPDDEQPPEESGQCQEQERPDRRWIRFR